MVPWSLNGSSVSQWSPDLLTVPWFLELLVVPWFLCGSLVYCFLGGSLVSYYLGGLLVTWYHVSVRYIIRALGAGSAFYLLCE